MVPQRRQHRAAVVVHRKAHAASSARLLLLVLVLLLLLLLLLLLAVAGGSRLPRGRVLQSHRQAGHKDRLQAPRPRLCAVEAQGNARHRRVAPRHLRPARRLPRLGLPKLRLLRPWLRLRWRLRQGVGGGRRLLRRRRPCWRRRRRRRRRGLAGRWRCALWHLKLAPCMIGRAVHSA